ncbi:MAG TPA: CBS domain-containing protein [Candidatus Binatia bacterium]|jgi:CBS domain-containing protein
MADEGRETYQTSIGQGRQAGAQSHDGESREDEGPEREWNRRRRYGAFYASAAERAQQRQRSFEGRGARGHASMGEGEGGDYPAFTPRSSSSGHTPRSGYRSWGGRESTEYGRGEERYGNEHYAGERHANDRIGADRLGTERYGSDRYRGDLEERTEPRRDIGHEQLYDRGARTGHQSRWQRESLTAREIMTSDVKTVRPTSSLADVALIMKEENCGIVPVIDDERKLRGVVTDRDIVIRGLAEAKNPLEMRVADLMTDDVNGVTSDETVTEVIELMGSKQVRRVPVVDRDDRLLGIIALADVANRADYDEDLQEALERISTKRSFWSRLWS